MPDINKMINWMMERKGKVTYSMNARLGPASYDCSSAVYFALIAGGFLPPGNMGNTDSLFGDLEASGWQKVVLNSKGYYDVKRGDIFIWGDRGASGGAAGHTGIFTDDKDTIIHCNYGYNGISVNDHDAIWGYNGKPSVTIYRYVGKSDNKPQDKPRVVNPQSTPQPQKQNDVEYMCKYGYVQWNHKVFKVDDRSNYAGILQVVSRELSGIGSESITNDLRHYNGVPMAGISWADGTPNSSDEGTSFRFDQDEMAIVDYDVPTNGIAVMVAGFKVWVDATVAKEA